MPPPATPASEPARLSDAEIELAKLVAFFRDEGYARFGWEGDTEGLTPAETAIKAMRAYASLLAEVADYRMKERADGE